jgi:asparagine synthase (glutamine-hydrolysing)
MCGLSGYYYPKSKNQSIDKLEKMASSQSHRGPDYTGYYYYEGLGLAHNRLSLLDLSSNGNQPFENEKIALIFNGEIYNFNELRKELSPFESRSSGDTEVLFQCLLQWGLEQTLTKIKGMFAFAYYEKYTKDLYLCRDRFGIKPLFYGHLNNHEFVFSSELKAITSVWDCETDSIQMLFSSLGILEKSDEKTAWKNISIVPAGGYVCINKDTVIRKNYFDVLEDVNEVEYERLNNSSWQDVIEEFDYLMNESVKKMLVSDSPMGAYISGGIDSSLIASIAQKYQKSDFKLFTANVTGKFSEFADAQLLSKHLNSELFDYKFEKEMTFRDWAKVTWHYETPVVTHFNALPFSNVSKLAHEHKVKAVLTGEGSDELFLGYPRLLTRRYDGILKTPYTFLNSIYSKHSKLANYMDSNRGSGGLLGLFEIGVQGFRRQIVKEAQIDRYSFLNKNQIHDQYMSAQMMQEGIRSLLWRNDRMGMIYSIESRFPFLDEDVVKFAMNLPVKFKIGRTNKFYNYKHPFLMDKAIVRKSAEKKLPSQLVYKKKNGFPLHGLREIKVDSEFFYDSVFADLLSLGKNQINYFVNNTSQYHVALIASFEIWAKLFVKKNSVEEVDNQISLSLKFK